MEDLQLSVEDAENWAEWRRRTRVADPLHEESTAWRREREAISYWWSFGMESLYFQPISRYMYRALSVLGVASLTFWSHVTSSVAWPFASP